MTASKPAPKSKYQRHGLDPADIAAATELAEAGASRKQIADKLECSVGMAALHVLCGREKPYRATTDRAIAAAIAKDRDAGASWGTLMARSGLALGAVHAAYADATRKPVTS